MSCSRVAGSVIPSSTTWISAARCVFIAVSAPAGAAASRSRLESCLLGDDGVARVGRRLEAGPEDRPAKRRLAGEDERAARNRRRAAALSPPGEQRPSRRGQPRGKPRVAPGLSLAVDLPHEAEPPAHPLGERELDDG